MKTAMKAIVSFLMVASLLLPAMAQKHSDLSKEAKVTMKQAREKALAKEPGTIKDAELEKEKGKLIYSFDIATKSGIHEVQVDALTAEIVSDKLESPQDEAKEQANDAKEKSKNKKNPGKTDEGATPQQH